MHDRYDSASKAPGIRLPALIVHGSDDELIPVAMGRRLAELLPKAELRVVAGAHHNDVWSVDRELVRVITDKVREPAVESPR